MGVDISDIVHGQEKSLRDFGGKMVAVDAFNALYQFLSIIRQPDGTPLQDSKGRVTSHLSGLFYRNANLLEFGIKPVYVFDGKPHHLKRGTIEARIAAKEKAKEEWAEALERGDLEKAKSKAQQTSRLTAEMVNESKQLLTFMGIPWLVAPGEGEGQASYMALKGDVWATASQDFDSLLFGAPQFIRNFAVSGRRKLPRKNIYVEVRPELICLEETLKSLGITKEQLVDLSILVGTDFNEGVHGIGPKKALKLVREFSSLERIMKEKEFGIAGVEEIRRIFLEAERTDDYSLVWKKPDEEKVKGFLCGEYEFSEVRVQSTLERISVAKQSEAQRKLDQWF